MRKRLKVIVAVLSVPALALGWWLGSPLFIDRTVDEAFPVAIPLAAADTTTTAVEEEPAMESEDMVDETMDDGPSVLSSGTFRDADSSHRASGTATFYQLEDGTRILRFEDFQVTNGPDLRVLLVPAADPQSREDVAGYLELAPLTGNVGNQNYVIPDDVDLSLYGSVVIYCTPFHVIFGVATLES
jgi:hypothetical protein